jgi:hypothetical protein
MVKNSITIGFAGNLLRPEINRELVLHLIKKYPQTIFNFCGPSNYSDSNVDGDTSDAVKSFIQLLNNASNVFMHGVLSGAEIANFLAKNDILLLPLKNNKNFDGSNSHKIIEYLSTGNVIVSQFVSTYSKLNLLEMAASDKWEEIASVFEKVYSNISLYNSQEKMRSRIDFALSNTYSNHILQIENHINI